MKYLRNHIESQHLGVRYPCDLCDTVSTSLSSLKDHKRKHHCQKPFVIKHCEYCDYSTKNSLKKHVNSVHLNIKPVQCEVCDKKLRSNIQLKLHIRSVHQKKTEQCDICFKYVRSLRQHKKCQHKKANCKYCDKQFDKYNAMDRNIKKEKYSNVHHVSTKLKERTILRNMI